MSYKLAIKFKLFSEKLQLLNLSYVPAYFLYSNTNLYLKNKVNLPYGIETATVY